MSRVTTAKLREWLADLSRVAAVDDADRVEQLRVLEDLKNAIGSVQAVNTVEFVVSTREKRRAEGILARRLDDGIASEVASARRESPYHGARHVGLAFALLELPYTAAAFARGEISEWRATIVARETACLSREDRQEVDRRLGGRKGGVAGMGDQELAAEARRIAYALDPEGSTRRAAKAKNDRRVTLRPAPDTMTYLSGLLPVREGVAVYAALTKQADALRARGDERSRGQIMADTLVERVTGLSVASEVPVEVNVVMSDGAVFGDADSPAATPRPTSTATGRCRLRWRANGSRTRRRRCGSGGCTHAPMTTRLGRMDSMRGCSPGTCVGSSGSATSAAAPRGVMLRSGTRITRSGTPTVAPPTSRTHKACARPATTRRKHRTGIAASAKTGPWRPPHPQGTATEVPCPVHPPTQSGAAPSP